MKVKNKKFQYTINIPGVKDKTIFKMLDHFSELKKDMKKQV